MGFFDFILDEIAEKVADDIRSGATAARIGATSGAFLTSDDTLRWHLFDAADKMDAIASAIDDAEDIMKDLKAAGKIRDALRRLNKHTIETDPEGSARAFGALFANVGRIARHLPPPLNAYGTFLEGFDTFFVDMFNKISPTGTGRVGGDIMRDLMEDRDPSTNPAIRR